MGAHAGAGLAWPDPASGLSVEARAQGLLTHEDGDFRTQGYSGALAWDMRPSSEFGGSMSLRLGTSGPAWGSVDTLLAHGISQARATGAEGRQLEGILGYGFPLDRGRLVATPEVGFALSIQAGR